MEQSKSVSTEGNATNNTADTDYKSLFEVEQKRRRGSQSAYGKLAAEKKALELELEDLRGSAKPQLTDEQAEHLEGLKVTDPEAYYTTRKSYESNAERERAERLDELNTQAQTEVKAELLANELNDAELLLKTRYPDFSDVVTKETLEMQLPPVLTEKLKSGEESAEDFLDKAYAYLSKNGKVKSPEAPTQPSLGSVAGNTRSSNPANQQDFNSSYSTTIF